MTHVLLPFWMLSKAELFEGITIKRSFRFTLKRVAVGRDKISPFATADRIAA